MLLPKFNLGKTNPQPFALLLTDCKGQTAEIKPEKVKQMKIIWKEDNRRYGSGESAFVGKWKVASIHYDGMTSDVKKYGITILLPGIKQQENCESPKTAKARAEMIINYWFAEVENS